MMICLLFKSLESGLTVDLQERDVIELAAQNS